MERLEIQELRHKSQSAGDSSNASSTIDTSLISLDERIDSVSKGVKTVNESLEPLLKRAEKTPISVAFTSGEEAGLLRKHADLMIEWDAVQKESQVLREELKEDKWLTVFRTVTEQADGMMSSLEKAVNRCQVRARSGCGYMRGTVTDMPCRTSFGRCRNEGWTIHSRLPMHRLRAVLTSLLRLMFSIPSSIHTRPRRSTRRSCSG